MLHKEEHKEMSVIALGEKAIVSQEAKILKEEC